MIMNRIGGGEEILEPIEGSEDVRGIQPMSAKPRPLDPKEEEGTICVLIVSSSLIIKLPPTLN